MPTLKKVYTESYRSGFYHPISILILALITLTVALAIFANSGFFTNKNVPTPSQTPQPSPKLSPKSSPADETANWKTYTNQEQAFTIKYPQDLQKSENKVAQDDFRLELSSRDFSIIEKPQDNDLNMLQQKITGFKLHFMVISPPRLKNVSVINFIEEEIGFSSYIQSKEQVTTGNNIFTKVTANESHGTKLLYYVTMGKQKGIAILVSSDDSKESQNSILKILSTFQFLN